MAKRKNVSLLTWLSGNTAADQQRYKAYADVDRFAYRCYLSNKKLGEMFEKAKKFREAHPEVCKGVFHEHVKLELKHLPMMFPLYGVLFALVRVIVLIVCYAVGIAVLIGLLQLL